MKQKNDLHKINSIASKKWILLLNLVIAVCFNGFTSETLKFGVSRDSLLIETEDVNFHSDQIQISGSILGELVYIDSTSVAGFELIHVYEKTDDPCYIRMSLILRNQSEENYYPSSSDSLILSLRSGFDLEYYSPSGSPYSTDSDIKAIAMVEGNVVNYNEVSNTFAGLERAKPKMKWAGLSDKYFTTLILPDNSIKKDGFLPFTQTLLNYELSGSNNSLYRSSLPVLSFKIPLKSLAPGQQKKWGFYIFTGPKSEQALSSGPYNLDPLLFPNLWSWVRWICLGLLGLLDSIHFFIPSWGWTIILLALIVRICLYPLGRWAIKSQLRFVEAQKRMLPELKEIKKNYKGGEQSERILQLYKEHNVSPFAGLKPLLVVMIQLPILIALFHVLGSAYELRNASFLWIDTLAEPSRLFSFGFDIPFLGSYFRLLPVLMAIVTLLSFKLAPVPTVEKKEGILQNIFLYGMTLFFFILFYSFPAGMVLYWTFANLFHIIQYQIIMRTVQV